MYCVHYIHINIGNYLLTQHLYLVNGDLINDGLD
jgi:hypothetical protein